jgi:hypothetical protein
MKAKEIAAALTRDAKLGLVERHEINSLLYGELESEVTRDGDFAWSLSRTEPEESPLSANQVEAEKPPLIRAVQCLRSGLPPGEMLRHVTVGADRLLEPIEALLKSDAVPRWIWVKGNYGEGKSHTLSLAREVALGEGFAVCHLSADATSAALNHPQRFLPLLLSSLEVPGIGLRGYQHLLEAALKKPAMATIVRSITRNELARSRKVDLEAGYQLDCIVASHRSGNLESLHERIVIVSHHLCGESIAHRQGTADTRELVYSLMRVAAGVIAAMKHSGILILLDEVESVYTKLHNSRSRTAAARVLSALCEGPAFPDCRVVLAVTPDAIGRFEVDRDELLADGQCIAEEPLNTWVRRLDGVSSIDCLPLSRDDRLELLARVRSLYERLYGHQETGAGLSRLMNTWAAAELPVRLLVRQMVDHLDTVRFSAVAD